MGICFADRGYIKREWRRDGWRAESRQWKQKGAQRWCASISKARWIIFNVFCSIIIILVGVSLGFALKAEGKYQSTDIKSL